MRILLNMVYLIALVWVIKIGDLLKTVSQHLITRLEPQLRVLEELKPFNPETSHHKRFSRIPIYVFKDDLTDPGSVERITRTYNNSSL